MIARLRRRAPATLLAVLTAGGMALISRPIHADQQVQALYAQDFSYAAPRGFGDRGNSWAQAMTWWHNALYVGTARESVCTAYYALWQFVGITLGFDFANTWLAYPPADPDLSCVDGADLPIQAEIQRWDQTTGLWTRVFQSPLDLDNPGPGAGLPAPVGKKLPWDTAIRGFAAHVEPDGTEALYAFGVNSTIIWDRTRLPPPRILRSTDGIEFTPLLQDEGTFLHDLPFNPDHSSFRAPVSFNGKLFVICGPVFGQGTLIASADPEEGNDSWFVATDPSIQFYETAVFNGWLYLGTLDANKGYSVVKTRADGAPPYQLIPVIPPGAYLTDFPSKSVVSMEVFNGRLYVGTATFPELIAINPDDTWSLIMGAPRQVPSAGGGTEWMYPRSGLNAGFGQTLNDHVWQMDDRKGHMYAGTYNSATPARTAPGGSLLANSMGAQVFSTMNGWYYIPVTLDGFANLGDPLGGKFDYGIRTMSQTPAGLFFGTANDYYGLAILQSPAKKTSLPDPSTRFDIEPAGTTGAPLLSWKSSTANKKVPKKTYQVFRAAVNDILIRDSTNFEGFNGVNGNKIRDTYVGGYTKVGETPNQSYIDFTAQPGQRYMYYIVENTAGVLSAPSNLAAFPLMTPAATFAQLLHDLDIVFQRGRYADPTTFATLRSNIVAAQTLAASCSVDAAASKLSSLTVNGVVLDPEATDIQILIDKLVRRLQLDKLYPQYVLSTEICAP